MATWQFYNHTINAFNTGVVTDSDTFKVILLSSSASFDATDTTINEATNTGAWEVYGNGWTQGGMEIANPTVELSGTNGSKFDGDDIVQQITGGSLGPVSYYIVVDTTQSMPLGFVTLTTPQTVAENNNATIVWDAAGIIVWSEPA